MDTKQYWDELADLYQVTDATTDWLLGYPQVLRLLGDLNGKSVLDYGCGNGRFTRFMAETYPLARIIGVDTSPQAIENARANTAESLGIEYHHIGSHDDLPQFDFERACANFVFCTIPNIETLEQICQTIYDQLPPGGIFILMEPHPDSHGHRFTSFASDPLRGQKSGDQVHVRLFTNSIDLEFEDYYWTQQDYETVLLKAGFAITATMEPIATDFVHPRLGEETRTPPFIIFKAVK